MTIESEPRRRGRERIARPTLAVAFALAALIAGAVWIILAGAGSPAVTVEAGVAPTIAVTAPPATEAPTTTEAPATTTTVDVAALAAFYDAVAATTTTAPPPPPTTARPAPKPTAPPTTRAPAPPVTQPPAQQGSGACGGDLPPCYVMMRESGGNIRAKNPSSSASGKWQFIDSTWAGYGGYSRAMDAPEAVQDAKARALWAGGRGCSHWSAC